MKDYDDQLQIKSEELQEQRSLYELQQVYKQDILQSKNLSFLCRKKRKILKQSYIVMP